MRRAEEEVYVNSVLSAQLIYNLKLFQKIKPINLIKKHTQRENIAASKSINIFNQLFTSTFHYLCTYMNMLCSRHHNNSETKSSSEQESLPLGFASLRYRKSLPLISPL